MKLEIESDGSAQGTVIRINGREVKRCLKFGFSVTASRKARLDLLEDVEGREVFRSYFGQDFRYLDGAGDHEVRGAKEYVGGSERPFGGGTQ